MILDALPDIPRTYTACAEWAACLVYILLTYTPDKRARVITTSSLGLPALLIVQLIAGALPVSLWLPGMIAAYLTMWALIHLGTQYSPTASVHLTARAFVLAEFVASFSWQLVTYFFPPAASRTPLTALLSLLINTLVLTCYIALEKRHFRGHEAPVMPKSSLWTGLAITVATFAMSNLSFATTGTPFSGRMGPEIFYIRTLIDLCGLVALYAQLEHILELRSATELASIEGTLRAQHNQYLQSKANIEAIGRANHDLKHQIALIRAEVDPDRTLEHFEELEHSVAALDQQFHSGNPVLDVILSAKAQTCASEGITLTVVADGTLLSAMSSLDIATLFGNALDNAIEASRKVSSPDHRLITLALHQRGEMTAIRVENWYDTALSRNADGDLVTTKKDRTQHGYGVKSIRWTAQKYGGEVTTHAQDHWFTLSILLPASARTAPSGDAN